MSISFCGVPLTLPTPEVSERIDGLLSSEWLWEFAQRTYPGQDLAGIGFRGALPRGPMKTGVLYWPATASRFACGHYLASEDQRLAIEIALAGTGSGSGFSGNGLGDLVLADGVNTLTARSMSMLPPRPLERVLRGTPGLYLLTLVDQRFYWWFRSAGISVDCASTSWSSLFAQIESGLEPLAWAQDSPNGVYPGPGKELDAPYQALPLLLDAAAFSVGQRVAVDFDGTVRVMNSSTGFARYQANLTAGESQRRLEGDSFDLPGSPSGSGTVYPRSNLNLALPATLTVVFDADYSFQPCTPALQMDSGLCEQNVQDATFQSSPCQGGVYAIVTPIAAALPGTGITGFAGDWRLHCSYPAQFTTNLAVPDNLAALENIALQAAIDWYLWNAQGVDARYQGILVWQADAIAELVEVSTTWDEISTRVQRGPWLDYIDRLCMGCVPCLAKSHYEYLTICEYGNLNTYQALVTECVDDQGCLQKVVGDWIYQETTGGCIGGITTSGSGSGSSGSGHRVVIQCPPVIIPPTTDVQCINGLLYVFVRTVALNWVSGCLIAVPGPWIFWHLAGCCPCPVLSGSTGSGSICIPGYCPPCFNPPYAWLLTVAGFANGLCVVFNTVFSPWELTGTGTACLWSMTLLLSGGDTIVISLALGPPNILTLVRLSGGVAIANAGYVSFSQITPPNCCIPLTFTLDTCNCGGRPPLDPNVPGVICCDSCMGQTPREWLCSPGAASGSPLCYLDYVVAVLLTQISACQWQTTYTGSQSGYQITVTLTVSASGVFLLFYEMVDNGGSQVSFASYTAGGPCCPDTTRFRLTSSGCPAGGASNPPLYVLAVPLGCVDCTGSGMTCPPTLTAIPLCCGSSGSVTSGTGSGSFLSGSGSGSGGQMTGCCPGVSVPYTLYAHVYDIGGNCTCMVGTYAIQAVGGLLGGWTGSFGACGSSLGISLICNQSNNLWFLTIGCPGSGNTQGQNVNCGPPFSATFPNITLGSNDFCCPNAVITVIVDTFP